MVRGKLATEIPQSDRLVSDHPRFGEGFLVDGFEFFEVFGNGFLVFGYFLTFDFRVRHDFSDDEIPNKCSVR